MGTGRMSLKFAFANEAIEKEFLEQLSQVMGIEKEMCNETDNYGMLKYTSVTPGLILVEELT